MALYEIETLYQKISSLGPLGKINLIFSKLLGRPKHQCYLRSKKCGRKTDIPYWITIVVSIFFFPPGFQQPKGTAVPRWIPTFSAKEILDATHPWDCGSGCLGPRGFDRWRRWPPDFFGDFLGVDSRKMKKWWLWLVGTGHFFPAILMFKRGQICQPLQR